MIGGITTTLLFGTPPQPAPAALINALQRVEVETSCEVASVFRLRFGMTQAVASDWDMLQQEYQDGIFKPFTAVQIRVKIGVGVPEAIINGYASGQQVLYEDQGGGSVLEITGMDATLIMNLEEKVSQWPSMADSDIATAIFAQYSIIPNVSTTTPTLVEPEGTTTQRGTDMRFLRRLAQRNGFDCFVQPQAESGMDQGFFGPASNQPGPPQAVISVRMGDVTNVADFRIRYDMARPTTAVGSGLDIASQATASYPALTPQTPTPNAGLFPLGSPMGLEDTVARASAPNAQPTVLPYGTGQFTNQGIAAATQAVVNRSSWAVIAEGTVGPDVGILRPGGIVNIRGVGAFYAGSYYVTKVSHEIDYATYVQRFEARRNAVVMTGSEVFVQS